LQKIKEKENKKKKNCKKSQSVLCVCYGQDFYFKFKRDEKCETGLIEAMATTSTTTSKIASLPLTVLLTLSVFAPILVFGCLPEPYRRQSRSRIFNKDNDVTVNVEKVFSLNRQGETVSIRPNLNARQGQSIYGRLSVPWSSPSETWTLEVLAHWSDYYPSTPLWLYIKRNGLPTTTDFDKTGVSFTSRQFSRVRLHEAEPGGTYFVMVEAMQDIRNLTMEMKLINDQQEQENSRRIFNQNSNNQRIPKILEESMRSSFSWPRRLSVP